MESTCTIIRAGQTGLGGVLSGDIPVYTAAAVSFENIIYESNFCHTVSKKAVKALNISLPLERENVTQMGDFSCVQILLKCCPANHLMRWGNGHFCLVLQRLRDRVGDCHYVIPLLALFQHPPQPQPTTSRHSFLPICGEIIFRFRNP